MSRLTWTLLLLGLPMGLSQTQPPPNGVPDPTDLRLPNGKLQSEEILKDEHSRSLREAEELVRLAEEIRAELERNDRHVVSVGQIKRLETAEKLVKRMKGRLTR